MGLADLFEFRIDKYEEYVKERQKMTEKVRKVVNDIYKLCRMLGGEIEEKGSELYQDLVCVFPEPIDIDVVEFKEIGDRKGRLYIQSTAGWHGQYVNVEDMDVRIEAEGVRGNATYDNTSGTYVTGERLIVRTFRIRPKKKAKKIKSVSKIEFSVSPNTIFVKL